MQITSVMHETPTKEGASSRTGLKIAQVTNGARSSTTNAARATTGGLMRMTTRATDFIHTIGRN